MPQSDLDDKKSRYAESKRRYQASEAGRESKRRYLTSEKGREAMRKAKVKWNRANADTIKTYSYKRKREQLEKIANIKLAAGCADCGYAVHWAALEFDHVDGGKVANVSSLVGRRWEIVEAEIAKCEVVCANCHRIRTVERLRLGEVSS